MADTPAPPGDGGNILERRIGPFPVVGWVALVGAGVGAGLLLRRSHLLGGAGKVAPVDNTIDTTGDPAAAGDVFAPGDVAGGGYSGAYNGPSTVPIAPQTLPTPAAITTNSQWSTAAIQWAVGQGLSPLGMSNAVAKYLNGEDLSSDEATLVSRAIQALGPPPEGAPAVAVSPPAPVLPPSDPVPPTSTPIPTLPPPAIVNTGNQTATGGALRFGVPGPGYGGRLLKVTSPMMSGQDVREFQARAQARGYGIGPSGVDGIFGPNTANAARAIQSDYHLSVDGIVGPQTWAATFDGHGGYGPNS